MMNTKTFKPSDELTFNTVQSDRKRLLLLLQDVNICTLKFDLSQVTHCDSAGLALLIEAKRLCHYYHKELVINDTPKEVRALSEFCGVEALLF